MQCTYTRRRESEWARRKLENSKQADHPSKSHTPIAQKTYTTPPYTYKHTHTHTHIHTNRPRHIAHKDGRRTRYECSTRDTRPHWREPARRARRRGERSKARGGQTRSTAHGGTPGMQHTSQGEWTASERTLKRVGRMKENLICRVSENLAYSFFQVPSGVEASQWTNTKVHIRVRTHTHTHTHTCM
jgi:hypothetical protein